MAPILTLSTSSTIPADCRDKIEAEVFLQFTSTHSLQLMVFAHEKYLPSFLQLTPPPHLQEVPNLSVHH